MTSTMKTSSASPPTTGVVVGDWSGEVSENPVFQALDEQTWHAIESHLYATSRNDDLAVVRPQKERQCHGFYAGERRGSEVGRRF